MPAPSLGAAMGGPSPGPSPYQIQKGDTLSALAKQHGTSVEEMMKANPQIQDPNKIYAGSQMNMPGAGASPAAPAAPMPPQGGMVNPNAGSHASLGVDTNLGQPMAAPAAPAEPAKGGLDMASLASALGGAQQGKPQAAMPEHKADLFAAMKKVGS